MTTDQEKIDEHVVSYYRNLFNNDSILQEDNLIEKVIPDMMNEQSNNLLTVLPSDRIR